MNILTFDLEDWFHLLDHPETATPEQWDRFPSRLEKNTHILLDLLDEHGVRSTFFCLGWVGRKFPHLLREIAGRRHEIACHSDLHRLVHRLSPQAFAADTDSAIKSIEDCVGEKVRAYRAPGFSINEEAVWAFEILAKAGIEIDCSLFLSSHAHGGYASYRGSGPAILRFPQFEIKEFPVAPYELLGRRIVFSGGGYFRLLPASMLLGLFRRSPYNMAYFHPRDFDPDQPMIPGLSWQRKFRSYYGLRSSIAKLKLVLSSFEFVALDDAARSLDWSKVPVVRLQERAARPH